MLSDGQSELHTGEQQRAQSLERGGDMSAGRGGQIKDALMRRVEVAQRLAQEAGDAADARRLAPRVLPGALTEATATAIARAESGGTALALLLVSPEFLRR